MSGIFLFGTGDVGCPGVEWVSWRMKLVADGGRKRRMRMRREKGRWLVGRRTRNQISAAVEAAGGELVMGWSVGCCSRTSSAVTRRHDVT